MTRDEQGEVSSIPEPATSDARGWRRRSLNVLSWCLLALLIAWLVAKVLHLELVAVVLQRVGTIAIILWWVLFKLSHAQQWLRNPANAARLRTWLNLWSIRTALTGFALLVATAFALPIIDAIIGLPPDVLLFLMLLALFLMVAAPFLGLFEWSLKASQDAIAEYRIEHPATHAVRERR